VVAAISCVSINTKNTKLFIKDYPKVGVQFGLHQCSTFWEGICSSF